MGWQRQEPVDQEGIHVNISLPQNNGADLYPYPTRVPSTRCHGRANRRACVHHMLMTEGFEDSAHLPIVDKRLFLNSFRFPFFMYWRAHFRRQGGSPVLSARGGPRMNSFLPSEGYGFTCITFQGYYRDTCQEYPALQSSSCFLLCCIVLFYIAQWVNLQLFCFVSIRSSRFAE